MFFVMFRNFRFCTIWQPGTGRPRPCTQATIGVWGYLEGGGGGNPSSGQPTPSPGGQYGGNPAAGGSGVFMVRYATPAP